jgi:transcriptional regulator with XRE-family HTH domain
MDIKLLGKRIRDERLLARLTIEQLSERVDKSLHFVGQIERGECNPSIGTLVDIANVLDTTVDSLLRDSLKGADDGSIVREINVLLNEVDDVGKLFILDVVKRYIYHHGQK